MLRGEMKCAQVYDGQGTILLYVSSFLTLYVTKDRLLATSISKIDAYQERRGPLMDK